MKDYYLILNLPKQADKNRIKKAYRDKVKALHPDKTGESGDKQQFLDAKEAYDTLTDDAKRAAYDRELKRRRNTSRNGTRIPISRSRGFSGRRRCAGRTSYTGRTPDADRFEAFGERPRQVIERRLELILSPKEAKNGGRFPISVPVFEPCPHCARGGLPARFFCPACGGEGVIGSEQTIYLSIPAGIAHGTAFEQPVQAGQNVELILQVTVLIDPRA